jgi:hypothetical protein
MLYMNGIHIETRLAFSRQEDERGSLEKIHIIVSEVPGLQHNKDWRNARREAHSKAMAGKKKSVLKANR